MIVDGGRLEHAWERPGEYWPRLSRATAALPAPVAVLDRSALSHNVHELERRARGVRIRVASKSVRCREVVRAVLSRPAFGGILAYSLDEAMWLAGDCDDIVVGYPSADRSALSRLATDPELARKITLMIDSPDQLDFIDAAVSPNARETLRLCLDVDVSYDLPGLRVGVWRSPVRTPAQARSLAAQIAARPGFRLVGVMAYEAQIAGLGDLPSGTLPERAKTRVIAELQRRSRPDVGRRRAEAVAAVRAVCDLEFVNGGGTGSLESTTADTSVTEVAAGSGLFGSHLFDRYRAFTPAPAAAYALDVVRKPKPRMATLLGGGWIASGPAAPDRQPQVVWPERAGLVPTEMAGEVQTPLRGAGAAGLRVGDRVWLRHAKAGELSEHANVLHLVDGEDAGAELVTYRGEGKAFL